MSVAVPLTDRRKLARDIGSTVGVRFAALPISIVASIVLARSLQPAGKGTYTTVMTIGELAVVLGSFGISTAAVYYLARARAQGVVGLRRAVLGVSLVIGGALSVTILAAAALFTALGLPQSARWALIALSPFGIVALTRAGLESFFRAEHLVHAINGVALVVSAAFLGALVVASIHGGLDSATAVAFRVGTGALGIVLLVGLARRRGMRLGMPRLDRAATRTLLAYGLPYAAYSIVQNLSHRADYLLVQAFDGSAAVGTYSVAVAQGELLWIIPTAVGFVLFPRVAARANVADARNVAETAALVRWTIVVTALGAVVLAAVARPVTSLMYGPAFLGAVAPLRVLLIGIVPAALVLVLSAYVLGVSRLRTLVVLTAAGFLCNIAANLSLIPRFGMTGAAAASALSYSLVAIGCVLVVRPTFTAVGTSLLPRPSLLIDDVARLVASRRDLDGRSE
jgi:O-antigen/teichoic acid export membrane protein